VGKKFSLCYIFEILREEEEEDQEEFLTLRREDPTKYQVFDQCVIYDTNSEIS